MELTLAVRVKLPLLLLTGICSQLLHTTLLIVCPLFEEVPHTLADEKVTGCLHVSGWVSLVHDGWVDDIWWHNQLNCTCLPPTLLQIDLVLLQL